VTCFDARVVERHGKRAIDGRKKPRAVRGEILRRAAVREGTREDHRCQIAGTQLIDRCRSDAPGQLLVFEPDRPVEHDHDEPPLGPHVVRDDIGRHVAHPGRLSGDPLGFRELDRHERHDRPGLAVFEDREVRRGQIANRPPVLVEHRDVDLHDIHAGPKGRWRLLRRLLGKERHDDARSSACGSGCDPHTFMAFSAATLAFVSSMFCSTK
jgi:hypothetical protein